LIDSLTTLFYKSGGNINDFNIPKKSLGSSSYQDNYLIDEELTDDIYGLLASSETMISQLNAEQCEAFNIIIADILHSKGGFYFVSGYGGTGKTFLWNVNISFLRAQRKIVLSVASSGVASLLLSRGSNNKF
jgi:hypothetical protein